MNFLGKKLWYNIFSLYGTQILSILVPLSTLPYLTRVLGPDAWGKLAALQALSMVLSLIIEYGFIFSATRDISSDRSDVDGVSNIVSGILGAKIILSIIAFVAGLSFFFSIYHETSFSSFLWTFFFALSQGWSPFWYFQANEEVRLAAIVEVGSRILGTLAIFLFVHNHLDVWKVLAAQSFAVGLGQIVNFYRMYKNVGYKPPTISGAIATIKSGFGMFLFRSAVSLYSSANGVFLKAYTNDLQVGFFSNADRLSNVSKGVIQPISQMLYPRINSMVTSDPGAAENLAVKAGILTFLSSIIVAIISFAVSPFVIPWFFGQNYANSVKIFQILILGIPIIAISNILGVQWMLPLKMDKAFNFIIISGGVVNILFIYLFVPKLQAVGMAYSVLFSELIIVLLMIIYLRFSGRLPSIRRNVNG